MQNKYKNYVLKKSITDEPNIDYYFFNSKKQGLKKRIIITIFKKSLNRQKEIEYIDKQRGIKITHIITKNNNREETTTETQINNNRQQINIVFTPNQIRLEQEFIDKTTGARVFNYYKTIKNTIKNRHTAQKIKKEIIKDPQKTLDNFFKNTNHYHY